MYGVELSEGVLASLTAAGVSTLGLLSMAALGDWGRRQSGVFSGFAVGVLSVAVIFHLAPEAIAHADNAWTYMLGSLGVMTLIGLFLRLFFGRNGERGSLAFGFASIFALGFHSFVDGVVYESSFHADIYTGWIATSGLLLHEFPEGVIAYFLMREARLSVTTSVIVAFFASSLTTVLGAFLTVYALEDLGGHMLDPMLAVAAGLLAYIVIFHLGPHAALAPKQRGFFAAALGVIVATLAEIIRHSGPHAH